MKRIVILAVIFGIFLFPGCGRKVVAVVNGEKITKEELRNETEKVAGRDVLANLIRKKIILQAAKKEGVYPKKEEIEKEIEFRKRESPTFLEDLQKQGISLEEYKNQIAEDLAEFNLLTKGIEVSDKEVEEAFKKYKPLLDRVRLKWIVNSSKEEIKKAKEKLSAGAFFETVAKDSSQDTLTKNRGGDLGYVSLSQLREINPKLADLAISLPLGKVSDIVELKNGYAIIRVEDRRIAELDSWRDFLKRNIMLEKANKEGRVEKVLKPLFEEAKVEIKDARYKGLETSISPPNLPF
jgi:foldase protein PrsA